MRPFQILDYFSRIKFRKILCSFSRINFRNRKISDIVFSKIGLSLDFSHLNYYYLKTRILEHFGVIYDNNIG